MTSGAMDPRNLLSAKELKRAERKQRYDHKNEMAGLGILMETKTGRQWMWKRIDELRKISEGLRSTPNVPDGVLISMYARQMERIMTGEMLLGMCETEFPEYTQMMFLEHMQEEQLDKQVDQAQRQGPNGGSDDGTD